MATNLYQGIKGKVYDYLVEETLFRERKNKNRGFANMMIKKYRGTADGIILSKNSLIELITEVASYDRSWRQILEHHPELRGSDYGDKDMLEQEKQLELGYGPH